MAGAAQYAGHSKAAELPSKDHPRPLHSLSGGIRQSNRAGVGSLGGRARHSHAAAGGQGIAVGNGGAPVGGIGDGRRDSGGHQLAACRMGGRVGSGRVSKEQEGCVVHSRCVGAQEALPRARGCTSRRVRQWQAAAACRQSSRAAEPEFIGSVMMHWSGTAPLLTTREPLEAAQAGAAITVPCAVQQMGVFSKAPAGGHICQPV